MHNSYCVGTEAAIHFLEGGNALEVNRRVYGWLRLNQWNLLEIEDFWLKGFDLEAKGWLGQWQNILYRLPVVVVMPQQHDNKKADST